MPDWKASTRVARWANDLWEFMPIAMASSIENLPNSRLAAVESSIVACMAVIRLVGLELITSDAPTTAVHSLADIPVDLNASPSSALVSRSNEKSK